VRGTSPSCASRIRRRESADLHRARHAPAHAVGQLRRYLENFFRKRFKLVGTPVRFVFKEGENPYKDKQERADRAPGREEAAPDAARQEGQVTRAATSRANRVTLWALLAGGRGTRLGGCEKAWIVRDGLSQVRTAARVVSQRVPRA
jgi:hypothetical protein